MGESLLQPSWVKSSKSARFNQLKHFFEGMDVLDIGSAVGYRKPDWMHGRIKLVAKSITGLDVDEKSVQAIKALGFEIACQDAQSFKLNKKFNLIHAGELIEHLENAGGFLDSVKDHLTDDGVLLITTPNGLRISNFIYAAMGGLRVNQDHTCWYCEYTIKLILERKGLEVLKVGYLKHETFGLFRKLFLQIRSMLLPDRVAWNSLFVLARKRKV